jgi:hypothetical protein
MFENIFGRKRGRYEGSSDNSQSPQQPLKPLKERRAEVEGLIDEFMKAVGCEDPSSRVDEQGWRWLQRGSAEGRVGVVEMEKNLFLQAESLIMPLPSDKDLILPLFRELLEYNLLIPGPVRLGIKNENVFASSVLAVDNLQREECFQVINSVMSVADDLDDVFLKKYGGTSKKRTGNSIKHK